MKATIELSIVTACITGLFGCAGSAAPPSGAPPIATPVASASCPPEGSFVPFNKVMNDAFVADYQGCDITTTAKFLMSGGGVLGLGDDYIIITAAIPGEQYPYSDALPKGNELAFALRPGNTILLRGGTYVPLVTGVVLKGYKAFVATSISRAK